MMSFFCPQCFYPGSLEITFSLQLPADSRSDDISLQVVECNGCGFRGLAVYEESRRGRLDAEAWEHTGYRIAEADLTPLIALMRSCPDPLNGRCGCDAHRTFGMTGPNGRWQGLLDVQTAGTFSMRLAH
jgi:hypothetical protein